VTEVRFYHLQTSPLERALPKLLEKVLEAGHRAVLLAGSEERVASLNGHLWTYEERSWLPHGSAADGNAAEQPLYLTCQEENPNQADVLVLIDGVTPAFTGDFSIAIDMFDGRNEDALAAARGRWRACVEKQYEVTYWQQGERGGWEKKQ
jgi:DNA polymerase-3 subunit chi